MPRIRVALVDDYVLVRKGMAAMLAGMPDIEVVGEAADGDEVMDLVERVHPDVLLMDLRMPRVDGIEATRLVRARRNGVKVLVLTAYPDDHRVLDAVRAGASGYLLKDVEDVELAEAVRSVHAGGMLVGPGAAEELSGGLARGDRERALTDRERDILGALGAGMSNRDIANHLGLSEKTVKNHVSAVLSKLDLVDRTQAALYAVRHGFAAPSPAP
ncbi:MAG: response regulator transcription factor [Actinobacteria bacterium]|nr:response regulator transcription factor [Actinomycetota bacterium]